MFKFFWFYKNVFDLANVNILFHRYSLIYITTLFKLLLVKKEVYE